MKNKTLLDSVRCAWRGMRHALKTEKNFKYYLGIAFVFLMVNLLCRISLMGHVGYLIVCGGVFAAEFINTAIERLADTYTTEPMEQIGVVKDIAASGVLVWGMVFFAMEALYIATAVAGAVKGL